MCVCVHVSGVQTRSQRLASSNELIEVKLPLKIVRLLVGDLVHHLLDNEDEEDDEEVGGDDMESTLSKLLAGGGARGGDWEVEEDQDLVDEPAYQLNLLVRGQYDWVWACHICVCAHVDRCISKTTSDSYASNLCSSLCNHTLPVSNSEHWPV